MNRRVAFWPLLGPVVLAAFLLAVGLSLRSALAAPCVQEDVPQLTIVKTVEGDGTIESDGAVSLLSSVAGYVLGRTLSVSGGGSSGGSGS